MPLLSRAIGTAIHNSKKESKRKQKKNDAFHPREARCKITPISGPVVSPGRTHDASETLFMSKVNSRRLHAEERRREIVSVLGQNGRITVEEVARLFGVSAVTARSDLDALSETGALVRSHGG